MPKCPNILPALQKLAKHSSFQSLRNEIKSNAHLLDSSCPVYSIEDSGRSNRRSKRSSNTRSSSRKQNRSRNRSRYRNRSRGVMSGGTISARQFKIFIYTVLMSIMAYLTLTPGAAGRGILDGFSSIYSGECGSMSQSIYAFFGMGNPICDSWNQLLLLIRNSLVGDFRSVATLGGILAIGIRTPMYIGYCIRMSTYYIARLLPPQVISDREIDVLRREANGSYRQLEIAVNRNGNGNVDEEADKVMIAYRNIDINTDRRRGKRNGNGNSRKTSRRRKGRARNRSGGGSGGGKTTKRKKIWSWIWK